jgi:uncharacterized BrkB/YihY/UPF0761 family membrane protein
MNYQYIVLAFIILFTLFLFVLAILKKTRNLLYKIHKSNVDDNSWIRYASSFLIVACVYMVLIQLYIGVEIDATLILGILGIAFTGKVGQKAFGERNIVTYERER